MNDTIQALKLPLDELEQTSRELRAEIIAYSSHARIPHLGSCLSCVDILSALYFNLLELDPTNPKTENRDRFILSKGHGAPALYQVLARRGFFPQSDMYREDHGGGLFGEHPPTPGHMPGIEAATGSLGHGLPMGTGFALAARIAKLKFKTFILLGDGECNEGSVWEAAMFAAAQKLSSLTVIVDFNKWQATDRSEEVMSLSPLKEKWQAFGWQTVEIDGHDISQILDALQGTPDPDGKPRAIIANTIKGRGVSFMEDDNNWHYRIPTSEEVELAKLELGVV
jgi:transketolase